jgi:Domain of unknown function (DUF1788)
MSTIEGLRDAYARFVRRPWAKGLSGPERVWMAIYPPREERRLRMRIEEFATATRNADHDWKLVDITDAFPEWLFANEYHESYFENPGLLEPALEKFGAALADRVRAELVADDVAEGSVVAILGVGALFGVRRVSYLLEQLHGSIRGCLLVFFPGQRVNNNYRLLNARDGWNYMATPIEADED